MGRSGPSALLDLLARGHEPVRPCLPAMCGDGRSRVERGVGQPRTGQSRRFRCPRRRAGPPRAGRQRRKPPPARSCHQLRQRSRTLHTTIVGDYSEEQATSANNTSVWLNCPVIDVRRLKALEAVVDTVSVSAAATLSSYSPSAVSQQMSALERETGVRLFEWWAGACDRQTPHCCSASTRPVLASIQDAEEALAALVPGHSGRIRLAPSRRQAPRSRPGASGFSGAASEHRPDLVVVESDEAITSLRSSARSTSSWAVETRSPATQWTTNSSTRTCWRIPSGSSCPARTRWRRSARWTWHFRLGALDRGHSRPRHCQLVIEAACMRAGFRPVYAIDADEYRPPRVSWPPDLGWRRTHARARLLAASRRRCRRLKGVQPARRGLGDDQATIADEVPVLTMLAAWRAQRTSSFVTSSRQLRLISRPTEWNRIAETPDDALDGRDRCGKTTEDEVLGCSANGVTAPNSAAPAWLLYDRDDANPRRRRSGQAEPPLA